MLFEHSQTLSLHMPITFLALVCTLNPIRNLPQNTPISLIFGDRDKLQPKSCEYLVQLTDWVA